MYPKTQLGIDRRTVERELLLRFVDRQRDAGKWLLSSLLLVNGGSVVALLSNEQFGARVLAASGTYFVLGVITSFFAGAASWTLSDNAFYGLRKKLGITLFENEQWIGQGSYGLFVFSMIFMVLLSMVSLGLFAFGAWSAVDALSATVATNTR